MCGIYGIVSEKVIPFDRRIFCTLGINNDSRGGDSCGIFVDGLVEYGVDKEKFFIDFMGKSELLKTVKKCRCAIGHDRKASVGSIGLKTAQPVVFRNEEGNIDFVVIHNGTIHNYLDLADKYIPDVDCSGMTDSQVMANIFYRKGYDCLSEYQGGAVFFIVDYREGEPRYFGWRGESKKTSYSKDGKEEERPFFFTNTKSSVIFSSIATYLYVVSPNVYILPGNTLIEFVGTEIYTIKEYSRDDVDQSSYQYDKGRKKVYNYPTSAHAANASVGGGNSWGDDDYDDEYDRWIGYWNAQDDRQQQSSNNSGTPSFREVRAIDSEKDRSLVNIQYDNKRDIYTNAEKLCHGEYPVSMYGYGPGYSGNKNNPKHYFWAGVHLCNREAFELLDEMAKKMKLSPSGILDSYSNLVHYLSGLPFKLNHKEKDIWCISTSYYSHDICKSAEVQKCFDGRVMTIRDGLCVGLTSKGYPVNYNIYKAYIITYINTIDFAKLKTIYAQ